MSEARIHELTQLRQQIAAIQSRLADLSTPEEIEQMLQPKRQREAALVASLEGDGIVVQGDNNIALAQRAAHLRDNQGILTTGDGNIIIIADQVAADFWRQFRGHPPDLQQATSQYLAYLVRQYRYLAFKGMGVSDRVPLRLPLIEMYVPLKARIEMPEGETWGHQLRLAGRSLSEEEMVAAGYRFSQPQPLVKLLQHNDGLIILGDPGAGKTTFLKYLALRLAAGEGDELGVGPRLPVLLPLSAYAEALARRDVPLHKFMADYYEQLGVELPLGPMLDEALARGGALLMLDGLDEVKETSRRQLVMTRLEQFFTFQSAQGNKFLLTSRIVGYKEVRPSTEGLAECTLVDFEDEEIEQFVAKWTQAIERQAQGEANPVAVQAAQQEQDELLRSIRHNPGVRRLASNPLLLTILALMKRQGILLPERRVELYQKYVETLLKQWNLARGLGRPSDRELDVVETVRTLAPLALWMHETSPGVGLVKREALRRELERLYEQKGFSDPAGMARQLLRDAREHAGLLLERGAGMYGFIHLTFQEYLAAVALGQKGQQEMAPVVEALASHVGDDNWHEVTLLTIGYLGLIQQRDEAATSVLTELMGLAPGEPGEAVILAGEAVADVGEGGVTPAGKNQVVEQLLATMQAVDRVKPRHRAQAGAVLAHVGDPRREVMAVDAMPFCLVPGGDFWMGEGKEQHRQSCLSYDYWLAQYPVTYSQYQVFMNAGGYANPAYWAEAREAGVWQDGKVNAFLEKGKTGPSNEGEKNQPVRRLTWYEALAVARWLDERWQGHGWLPAGLHVSLPTEAEWEKAGRGGLVIPRQPIRGSVIEGRLLSSVPTPLASVLVPNSAPKRHYPWGDGEAENRANIKTSEIGDISSVGCFPQGASPYGCEEMSGNVWEWGRSRYAGYPYIPDDKRERWARGRDDGTVLRGGAYYYDANYSRVGARYRSSPGLDFRRDGVRLVLSPFSSPSGL